MSRKPFFYLFLFLFFSKDSSLFPAMAQTAPPSFPSEKKFQNRNPAPPVSSSLYPKPWMIFNDIFGQTIECRSKPEKIRLFLFFTRKQKKRFEKFNHSVFKETYDHPGVEIILVLQNKGIKKFMIKKMLRELKEEFKEENKLRKNHLQEITSANLDLPGFHFCFDLDENLSREFRLSRAVKDPLAIFLDSHGKELARFSSMELVEFQYFMKQMTWPGFLKEIEDLKE